jgi:hypothetical protein
MVPCWARDRLARVQRPKLVGMHTVLRKTSSPRAAPSPLSPLHFYLFFFTFVGRSVRSSGRAFLSFPFLILCYCSRCYYRDIGRMHSPCLWPCLFLLVISIIILPRHLALAAPPARRSPSSSSEEASSSSSASSAPASIVWSSPAQGDRFGPGDTITGEWQVTSESENQKVVSPSFRLCAGGEDGCGATVWPEVIVDEESTGYYYVSLCVRASALSSYLVLNKITTELRIPPSTLIGQLRTWTWSLDITSR